MDSIQPYDSQALIDILGTENIELKKWDEIVTADKITFPLSNLESLGNMFPSVSAALSAISQIATPTGTLYRATFPVQGHLAVAKDGSGLLGTIINNKGIAGQARFHEVGQAAKAAGGASAIFMALAIMAINMSLKNIAENQKAIITFLETDKQTQLKGDLNVLTEVIGEYKYNWNNDQWLSNRENQVLNIKRSAEHNILFYREMIEKKLDSKGFIRFDTSKSLNDVQNKFKYYKLALYLYSFSSFLDIMLLMNFDSNYLDSIKSRIETYAVDYTSFYEKSIEGIEKMASSSVQSRALQGISFVGKFVGKQIAKIPDKNNKIKIDDGLISGSDKLSEINAKAIADTKDAFLSVQDNGIQMFGEKIGLINKMYNEPIELYIDTENIYLTSVD